MGSQRAGHNWSEVTQLKWLRVVVSTYLRLLMLLPPIWIPVCNSSSPAFLMMCSAYRLNKQGDSRQPSRTPFSILNQSVVPYRVLTVASWPAYRFLRRQVRCSGIPIPPQFVMIHTVKGFSIVSETDRCFSGIPLLCLRSSKYWQFDLWFLCLF